MRSITLAVVATALCAGGVAGQSAPVPPLFASADPIDVTFRADFSLLKDDRDDDAPERPATVVIPGVDGDVSIEAQLRTRGRFRREAANCSLPPLRLNLKKKQTEGTVFDGQDKMKVVGTCRPNRDAYEQLVLLEYLAYRTFDLVADMAFRTRLARITYIDESGESDPFTAFGFLIEDDDFLAERFGAEVFEMEEGKNLPPGYLDPPTAGIMGVFQYMIGNTDWSDVAAHNVELLSLGGIALPVPYDFDFSGVVDAPYAIPDPSLGIKDVTDRFYRGWCWEMDMDVIVQRFRDAEVEVMALWADFPHLDDGERARARRFLEQFFDEIESADRAQRLFLRHCRTLPN